MSFKNNDTMCPGEFYMLKLKNISKDYKTGDSFTHALIDINLEFRKNEFVSILGPSGCGKTTLLNIIGGLDRYQEGDLLLNNKSTKDFKNTQWDSYRNSTIGFVFQNYNLISHLTVLDNVEMAMALSGVGAKKRKQRAKKVLTDVGLADQINKKPNQLSGGQMQRVAIARALVNQPKIILADEPTGAIDSQTSISILNILKEISKDRLVIMVTHNEELAKRYSDRIITLLDGKVTGDSSAYQKKEESLKGEDIGEKKISMSFFAALKSSFKNLISKKARTIITAFAGSIGIIGIALVLAISHGMTEYVDSMQSDTLAGFPLTVNPTVSTDTSNFGPPPEVQEQMKDSGKNEQTIETDTVYVYDPASNSKMHNNVITQEYIDYFGNMDENLYNSISYSRAVALHLIAETEGGGFVKVEKSAASGPFAVFGSSGYFNEIPDSKIFIESQYELINGQGKYPEKYDEVLLIVDERNRIRADFIEAFGIQISEEYKAEDFIGMELMVIDNNDYYSKAGPVFTPGTDYARMIKSENTITLSVVGVMKLRESATSEILPTGIGYTTMLTDKVLENAMKSEIVAAQKQNPEINILDGRTFNDKLSHKEIMKFLGGDSTPTALQIYPISFDAKDDIKAYLDEYNVDKADDDKLLYSDLAQTISGTISSLINTITVILSAFAAISLVVSSIMIGIITYVSVVERTKEIGILRSIGARKKDISRVFIAESVIIGFIAGIIGVLATLVFIIPINFIIEGVVDASGFASLPLLSAVALIGISVALTFIAGLIPSRIAANKDPVAALKTE